MLNARCEQIHIYPGGTVVEFFLMFPSHNIRILLSGNGSNGSPTRGPGKRDDRTLNLAGRCLPPVVLTMTMRSRVTPTITRLISLIL